MSGPSRVLIVEDEWLVAETYSSILCDADYAIAGPTPSIEGAIELIDANAIDAALLDINLNGQMSYPIAERLAAGGVPFAFVTGYATPDLPSTLRHPIVSKPVSPEELLAVVRALLETRQVGQFSSPGQGATS